MRVLTVDLNGLELSMRGPKGRERIKINNGYPETELSKEIFSQLGLMHLIAPYLPQKVYTNFPLSSQITDLINAMYKYDDCKPPVFKTPSTIQDKHFCDLSTNPGKASVAYSAGKDSLWNMWWAQEKYGSDNVATVHINGLNINVASFEREYSKRQEKELGFKHFHIIDLTNSSKNTGYNTMRSRDMFLAGLIIPSALEFGASKIITEGFAEAKPTEPFSGLEENMKYFNRIIRDLGIAVQVAWRNKKEMDVIKDLLENTPDWLPHVYNCFSAPCYRPPIRRSWEKKTPTFKLYDSQCGSCVKCRITNLARILYDPQMKNVKIEDIKTYLENTVKWVRERRVELADMLEGSFIRDLKLALKKYGLALTVE